jgi:hypothetical protein
MHDYPTKIHIGAKTGTGHETYPTESMQMASTASNSERPNLTMMLRRMLYRLGTLT